MKLNATVTPKPGHQLWGIYYTDREYAREHGDPLRTIIEETLQMSISKLMIKLLCLSQSIAFTRFPG